MVLQHMRDWVLLQDGDVRWMTAADAVRARESRVRRLVKCILGELGGWEVVSMLGLLERVDVRSSCLRMRALLTEF